MPDGVAFHRAGVKVPPRPGGRRVAGQRTGRPADIPAGKYVLPDRVRHYRLFAVSMPLSGRGRADHPADPLGGPAAGATHVGGRGHPHLGGPGWRRSGPGPVGHYGRAGLPGPESGRRAGGVVSHRQAVGVRARRYGRQMRLGRPVRVGQPSALGEE